MKKILTVLFLMVMSSTAFSGHHKHHGHDEKALDHLTVDKLSVKTSLPGIKTTAGYLVLQNHSDKDVVINGVAGDAADSVELHDHIMTGGAMKMVEMESVVVPAKGSVEFRPGGKHIMFIGLKKAISSGDEVIIVFTVNEHHFLEVILPAKSQAEVMEMFGAGAHGGHHGHHKKAPKASGHHHKHH